MVTYSVVSTTSVRASRLRGVVFFSVSGMFGFSLRRSPTVGFGFGREEGDAFPVEVSERFVVVFASAVETSFDGRLAAISRPSNPKCHAPRRLTLDHAYLLTDESLLLIVILS